MTQTDPIIAALVNGQNCKHISLLDRGFSYGDGVFETIKVNDGKALLWEQHKQRLLAACRHLDIPFNDTQILDNEAGQLIKKTNKPAVLKLIITRGSGARGYRIDSDVVPNRILWIAESQAFPSHYQQLGIDVTVCKYRLPHAPELAKIKHLNRLDQVLARKEWQDEYQEGLVCDQAGHVIEGTMSNLFICQKETLLTPKLDNCGVAGIMRAYIIECALRYQISVTEKHLSIDEILHSNGAFLCNSLIGVWPIKTIDHQRISMSPLMSEIIEWVAQI